MKRFLLTCFVLSPAAPLLAQPKTAPEPPKQIEFGFDYSYTAAVKITKFKTHYSALLPGGKEAEFENVVTGQKGLAVGETLTFTDKAGKPLGTLTSSFDATGKLKTQTLQENNKPARTVAWFKTATQSPDITMAGSMLHATYSQQKGWLHGRVLKLALPAGPRTLTSQYDAQGRRTNDFSASPARPVNIQFFYGPEGLVRFFVPAAGSEKSREALLPRAKDGQLAEIDIKEGGVLANRLIPVSTASGESTGQRIENYENGVLSSVAASDLKTLKGTEEEYDHGVIKTRRNLVITGANSQRLLSQDAFENGKLKTRYEFDEKGNVTKTTTFKPDGSVDTTQDSKPDANTPATAPSPATK